MIYVGVQLISGIMVGIEFVWDDRALVLDLGIIRVLIQLGVEE